MNAWLTTTRLTMSILLRDGGRLTFLGLFLIAELSRVSVCGTPKSTSKHHILALLKEHNFSYLLAEGTKAQ